MGAIVSSRKQPRKTRVEHKAIAVNAFKPKQSSDSINPGLADNQLINETNANESSTNVAISSWGEGVVGTSTHALQDRGVVSSRGVDYDVATSKGLYPQINNNSRKENNHDYAIVTSLQPNDAAVVIQRHVRGHQVRKDLEEQRKAASVIQKHVRGHQVRKDLEEQQKAATVIQKKYRQHLDNPDRKQVKADSNDDDDDSDEDQSDKQEIEYRKAWKESTPKAHVLDKNMKIGDKTKESFENYQDDITNLKWKTEQQLELTTMGDDYIPPRVVLISSNVPRSDILQKIANKGVILINYDFSNTTLDSLLEEISKQLENYKNNSKARSIGFVSKGGPGYFNPVKGVMVTKKKVKQDDDISRFWKSLGTKMSKLNCQDTKIHIIGCNIAGNKQGEKLLKFLSKFMRPSIVKAESPLEMSESGKEMLDWYFDYNRYRTWKSRMYSKVNVDISDVRHPIRQVNKYFPMEEER